MAYREMTEEEWRAFLETPARPAVLGTVRSDGRPHTAPIWFVLDGDHVVFTTGADTVKARNLARDPRISLTVQDDQPPFSFVAVEGSAVTSDDLDEVRRWAAILGGRYMGSDRAGEYGKRNGVPGELLVRVRIGKVISAKDLAD